jgi:tRNA1Val (adenine37-N6)-methyltransferase
MFRFKQFNILQDRCGMKISSTATLFGAWVNIGEAATVLDIGTGTGLLSLMVAQRSTAQIDAIEIEPEAAAQADINFQNSPWWARLRLIHADICEMELSTFPHSSYEVILCNPPFFKGQWETQEAKRRLARHTETLDSRFLAAFSGKMLSASGVVFLLIDIRSKADYLSAFQEKGFLPCTIIEIKDKRPSDSTICLILAFRRQESSTPCEEGVLYLTGETQRFSEKAAELLSPYLIVL